MRSSIRVKKPLFHYYSMLTVDSKSPMYSDIYLVLYPITYITNIDVVTPIKD